MPTTLKLVDGGGTTINLIYHSSSNPGYQLTEDWEPQVAPLRDSEIGGRGSYEDVLEEIPLRIFGSTAADAYAKLRALMNLLDQAERWWKRQQVAYPVLLHYSPNGATTSSSATPLRALILGRPPGENGRAMALPARFNRTLGAFVINGIRLRFLRRGEWLLPDVASTNSSAAAANGSIHTSNVLAVGQASSPFTLKLKGFNPGATLTIPASLLLITATDDSILAAIRMSSPEAEGMTATGYTSVADAGNNARGGNVLRYTPSSTNFATSGNALINLDLTRRFAVYALVRNNSASATFRIRPICFSNYVSASVNGPETFIDASTTNPRIVFLGEIVRPTDIFDPTVQYNKLALQIAASTTTGPPTLDIDYLVFLALEDESSAAIELGAFDFQTEFGGSAATEIQIEHGRLTLQGPRVRAVIPSPSKAAPMSYTGNIAVFARGTQVQALWMCPNGTNWRYLDATPALLNTSIELLLAKAYLTPE